MILKVVSEVLDNDTNRDTASFLKGPLYIFRQRLNDKMDAMVEEGFKWEDVTHPKVNK